MTDVADPGTADDRPSPDRRRETRRIVWLGTAVALVAAVAAGVAVAVFWGDDSSNTASGPAAQASLTEVDQPELGGDGTVTFTTFDGAPASTADYRGRPLVVNFFASWCTPCIAEMPDFEAVHQTLGDDVAFLGLALRDPVEEAQALVERTGVTYDVGRDSDGSALAFYGGLGMPTTVFLDAEGTVVEVHSGQLSAAQLERIIREQLLTS